jgi:SAM-dependent methyltransferase
MRPETYRMLAEREDTYWWHVARRATSIQLLRRCDIPRGGRWLDLGCGPGGNLTLPAAFAAGLTIGVDISPIALSIARRKKPLACLVRADLNNALPFVEASFDVATIFNVLYHDWVNSEVAVLAEIRRVLRPDGVLLITEPAFAILARNMDVAAMGHRRYRITDIAQMCEAAGLRVDRTSYFTSFGFPLLILMKALRWVKPRKKDDTQFEAGVDVKPLDPIANDLLLRLSDLESLAIAAGFHVPFGTTLLCLARKI